MKHTTIHTNKYNRQNGGNENEKKSNKQKEQA